MFNIILYIKKMEMKWENNHGKGSLGVGKRKDCNGVSKCVK